MIIAHVPTHAVSHGFLPAARKLGLEVLLVTDRPEATRQELADVRILGCDVFNPLAVLDVLCAEGVRPEAVFSNSDHLQSTTAVVAQYFQVPHKPLTGCYRAKHKAEMRRHLQHHGIETLWFRLVKDRDGLNSLHDVPFPCVLKPCKGVASLGVRLAENRGELERWADEHFATPGAVPLLLEEYLPGTIYSLETLGDSRGCRVLGGFTCTLAEPPSFIETEARWGLGPLEHQAVPYVLRALECLETTWGACHTEFVAHPGGLKIIEVNYRSIGDQSDFMLNHLLGGRYFESVLRIHRGETPDLPEAGAEAHSAARYLFARRSGRLQFVPEGFDRELDGCRVAFVPARVSQDVVELSLSNKDYLAMLHVTGPGRQRVEQLLATEAERLEAAIAWA